MAIHTPLLLSFLSLAASAVAGPNAVALKACSDIQTALKGKVSLANEDAYIKENKDYWHAGLSELMPTCITFPTSPEDVSAIVKILGSHTEVPFAIKSGGHDPNPGHSSVKDGVLIALRHINGTVYDKTSNTVVFKPGGHWYDVMKVLNKENVAVVAGRLGMHSHFSVEEHSLIVVTGIVGIGGYMMQGGISFLSAQHGLAADVSIARQ
jgi:FAD/FMN-containing dehydrogenase